MSDQDIGCCIVAIAFVLLTLIMQSDSIVRNQKSRSKLKERQSAWKEAMKGRK